MLSLSQDQQNPSCIQFDDSNWQMHLTSLKPLGLNVLLNLCNASVTERLCRFSDHLCNIALQETHSTVLPVHVPWGLCELARLIGKIGPDGRVSWRGRGEEEGWAAPHCGILLLGWHAWLVGWSVGFLSFLFYTPPKKRKKRALLAIKIF